MAAMRHLRLEHVRFSWCHRPFPDRKRLYKTLRKARANWISREIIAPATAKLYPKHSPSLANRRRGFPLMP